MTDQQISRSAVKAWIEGHVEITYTHVEKLNRLAAEGVVPADAQAQRWMMKSLLQSFDINFPPERDRGSEEE